MKTLHIFKPVLICALLGASTLCFADATQDLLKAVKAHSADDMKKAIAAGADINGKDTDGNTALGCAIFWPDEVKILIDAKADVNLKQPLSAAATWGVTESAAMLLKAGADVNALNPLGQSALWTAAFAGCKADMLKLLMDAGAKVDGIESGMTPLTALCRTGKTPAEKVASIKSVVPFLQKAGLALPTQLTDPKESDYSSISDMVKVFIAHNANINATNKVEQTVLIQAADAGRTDAVQALIDAKANLETKSATGWTALAYAANDAQGANAGIALINAGANVNVTFHVTSLDVKASKKPAYVSKRDLALAKDPSKEIAKDGLFNVSPLMLAAKEGSTDLVKALIAAHADVNVICRNVAIEATKKITGSTEQTAAAIAHTFNHDDIAELLKAAGARSVEDIQKK